MSQDAWMETTPIGADFPHPAAVAAVTFYFVFFLHLHLLPLRFLKQRGGGGGASLFRILLLLRASSHFYPFPPSPTPDSSLYRCSHKSHNAPVIITPTPVYLQPVAWRGASLSLSRCLLLSLSSPSSSLLSFLIFFFFPPSVIFLLLQVSFLFSRSLPLYVLFHWDKTLKFDNKLLSRSTSSFAFFKMKNNKKCWVLMLGILNSVDAEIVFKKLAFNKTVDLSVEA